MIDTVQGNCTGILPPWSHLLLYSWNKRREEFSLILEPRVSFQDWKLEKTAFDLLTETTFGYNGHGTPWCYFYSITIQSTITHRLAGLLLCQLRNFYTSTSMVRRFSPWLPLVKQPSRIILMIKQQDIGRAGKRTQVSSVLLHFPIHWRGATLPPWKTKGYQFWKFSPALICLRWERATQNWKFAHVFSSLFFNSWVHVITWTKATFSALTFLLEIIQGFRIGRCVLLLSI